MQIRIAGIENDSIVDGPGFRLTVFTQGCPHDCPGCHNPETHAFEGGRLEDTGKIAALMADNPLLDGLTLSGGEPFCQGLACAELATEARRLGLNVWAYSGWTFEALRAKAQEDEGVRALLRAIDVLVDGPFLLSQRTLELRFRGSRNQRLIDVPASLATGSVVEKAI